MRPTPDAAPSRFYRVSGAWLPWPWALAALFAAAAVAVGLLHAPTDAREGEAWRIASIHLPTAWVSMALYLAMAGCAAGGWIGRVRLASMLARALAPTGLVCTVVALVSGAFWGKATRGTWWVWDARLTSGLILLLLYAGYLALVEAIDDPRRGDRAGALLAVVGAVHVPIIHFSVRWWSTLHPGASIAFADASSMTEGMLLTIAFTTLAFCAWAFAIVLVRARAIVLERERETEWVRSLDLRGDVHAAHGRMRRATA